MKRKQYLKRINITNIKRDEIMLSRNIHNLVWVDLGHSDGTIDSIDLGDGKKLFMPVDVYYSGHNLLRRSGKVLSVPTTLKYHRPYILKDKVREIHVKVGDLVFFEPNAKQWCEDNNKVYQTEDGAKIYAMNYHLLICTLNPITMDITMLNGKMLAKHRPDLNKSVLKSDIIILLNKETPKDSRKWMEITEVNNDEGHEGVYLTASDYLHMDYKRHNLQKGDFILVNKFAEFDVQSVVKEVKDVDDLQTGHRVSRSDIVAYRKKDSDEILPYGLFAKVKPETTKDEKKSPIISLAKKSAFMRGEIVETGSGFSRYGIGETIMYMAKNKSLIDGYDYVHTEWC